MAGRLGPSDRACAVKIIPGVKRRCSRIRVVLTRLRMVLVAAVIAAASPGDPEAWLE